VTSFDLVAAFFSFLFGACVGSFLNVVAYRIPAGKSIVHPPSACPKCGHRLAARDNIPILGWILLRGKCRYCKEPVSARYPLVEFFTASLFAFTYIGMFVMQWGPCVDATPAFNQYGMPVAQAGMLVFQEHWPIFVLYVAMIGFLLAASLIDADHFIIPLEIPWLLMAVGIVAHAFIGNWRTPGHLVPTSPAIPLMTILGGIGLIASIVLLRLGVFRQSFAEGEPMLDHERKAIEAGETTASMQATEVREYSSREVRREILHEVVFLLPPLLLAALGGFIASRNPALGDSINATRYLGGAIGAIFGAFIAAMVVWATRILGSIGFGKEAMGMGDVHLMLGIGAVIGAAFGTIAFFVAPFMGLVYGVYRLVTRQGSQLPYGPYLAAASFLMIFIGCPIWMWLLPGLRGLLVVMGGASDVQ
jgi:leader peptidase (prepilin peptidase)/N-methyltransferase